MLKGNLPPLEKEIIDFIRDWKSEEKFYLWSFKNEFTNDIHVTRGRTQEEALEMYESRSYFYEPLNRNYIKAKELYLQNHSSDFLDKPPVWLARKMIGKK